MNTSADPQRARATTPRVAAHVQRWLGIAAFLVIMVVVVALALADHPVFAARVFAILLGGIGVVRVALRDHPVWFAARTWWIDAACLFALAAAIGYLSFYGGRVMPSLG